jgi:serine/threonine protein kinase
VDARLAEVLRDWLADEQRREAALLSAGYQGSAYLYQGEIAGQAVRLVIKRAAAGIFTGWFHRLMLKREARIYACMASVKGVPHSSGLLDSNWLILEYIEGESLKTARYTLRDNKAFYDRLLQVLHNIHDAGVAHGDLKRKENILVTADEQPCVIDFGTAVIRHGSLWDRLVFRIVRRMDYNAWIKVKYSNDYSAIAPGDAQWYRPTVVESGFRLLRRLWRTVTFRQARKAKKRHAETERHD